MDQCPRRIACIAAFRRVTVSIQKSSLMSERPPAAPGPPPAPITDPRDLAERLTSLIEWMDEVKKKLSTNIAASG
jgi:hypothetical protein